jgi:hypothetical protein
MEGSDVHSVCKRGSSTKRASLTALPQLFAPQAAVHIVYIDPSGVSRKMVLKMASNKAIALYNSLDHVIQAIPAWAAFGPDDAAYWRRAASCLQVVSEGHNTIDRALLRHFFRVANIAPTSNLLSMTCEHADGEANLARDTSAHPNSALHLRRVWFLSWPPVFDLHAYLNPTGGR